MSESHQDTVNKNTILPSSADTPDNTNNTNNNIPTTTNPLSAITAPLANLAHALTKLTISSSNNNNNNNSNDTNATTTTTTTVSSSSSTTTTTTATKNENKVDKPFHPHNNNIVDHSNDTDNNDDDDNIPCATSSTTALIYDSTCLLHRANYAHVEKPERILHTMKLLKHNGLYSRCIHIPIREATNDELLTVHTLQHIQSIDDSINYEYGEDELDSEDEYDKTLYPDCKFLDSDTFVNRFSSKCARLCCGGLIDLMSYIIDGHSENGFAIIRPPGHHADEHKAQGFCLYNNVAVAVKSIQRKYPDIIKKILIIDWDVHHGNGTQNMFYTDNNVLYFSIHRYNNGTFYPYTGNKDEIGKDEGIGYNINIPLNQKGLGDNEYIYIFNMILLPIINEYKPDFIIVSAGFDAALGDPLGGMEITPEGYAYLTYLLIKQCKLSLNHNRIILVLEGGYNIRAISQSISACISILLGDPLPELHDNNQYLSKREIMKKQSKYELFKQDIEDIIKIQKKYWKCLKSEKDIAKEEKEKDKDKEKVKVKEKDKEKEKMKEKEKEESVESIESKLYDIKITTHNNNNNNPSTPTDNEKDIKPLTIHPSPNPSSSSSSSSSSSLSSSNNTPQPTNNNNNNNKNNNDNETISFSPP